MLKFSEQISLESEKNERPILQFPKSMKSYFIIKIKIKISIMIMIRHMIRLKIIIKME